MSRRSDVVVVIAHPDDEVFVSGTICLLAERGFRSSLICVTDGGGAAGENQSAASIETLGAVRRQELVESAAALGVAEIVRLGFADVAEPADGPRAWDSSDLIDLMRKTIESHEPALLLTHGPRGGYGHPAHRLVHRCVMDATEQAGCDGSIFSFCAQISGAFFSWHFDQPADVRLDVREFDCHRAASLSRHRSQLDFFLQPYPPRTVRRRLSAATGRALAFTEFGRRRVPIGTCERFFQLLPTEGLALQRPPGDGRHFFAEHFSNDDRIQFDS
jgi:LmbE family N-acetylglucosaminyl deacetylase